jgi:hypothetical protein
MGIAPGGVPDRARQWQGAVASEGVIVERSVSGPRTTMADHARDPAVDRAQVPRFSATVPLPPHRSAINLSAQPQVIDHQYVTV